MTATYVAFLLTLLSFQPSRLSADAAPNNALPVEEVITENALNVGTNEGRNVAVLVTLLERQCNAMSQAEKTHNFNYYFIENARQVNVLYKKAIDKLLVSTQPERVAAILWQIYLQDDVRTFKLMVELQLYLYVQLQQYDKLSEAYLGDMAYYIYAIKNDQLHGELGGRLRAQLEATLIQLPHSLQQFYFEPEFCLWNNHYKEYAYSSRFVADGVRQIYTWLNSITPSSQYIWKMHIEQSLPKPKELVRRANFRVALQSESYEDFIFLDHSRLNRVYGWATGRKHEHSFWHVEFRNDALVFEQNGYFMCSTNLIDHEDVRRTIHGFNSVEYTPNNEACQWAVQKCPFGKNIFGYWLGALFP